MREETRHVVRSISSMLSSFKDFKLSLEKNKIIVTADVKRKDINKYKPILFHTGTKLEWEPKNKKVIIILNNDLYDSFEHRLIYEMVIDNVLVV